ncbi:ribosome biogenesis factor YjgA [Comamonas sp. NLF-1-9]|uniref:ribosome biogenesis factor YjgA n=1 Tax=Comamonas sp. NLF-1-9 TaxID=2853163 RepID=UPI001C47787D|nr:ribosome biogenesis factor YjgA [Comamonas sp. NLF-1-9]QXL85557.1 DUF615 domain-containing protein [Comamonas sp. NLF-1-9]
MPRKPTRGYYVKGQFIAEGSELDEHYKAELRGTTGQSKTERKRESAELQALGEALLKLGAERLAGLQLPDRLLEALAQARRITAFEGRRRQMQLVGKLMRKLDEELLARVRAALDADGSAQRQDTLVLHQAEQWRDRLLADDAALAEWLQQHPDSDIQHLRALIRQARKDKPEESAAETSQGQAPRKSRAHRELFQALRAQLLASGEPAIDGEEQAND